MLTQERLIELLTLYENGCFYNNYSRGPRKADSRAGFVDVHGYHRITIDGVKYYEHHLVWLWVHGEWPNEIDHINGDRSNNSPSNLRLCNRTQNNCNSKQETGESGLRGAYLDHRSLKWYSKIQFGGQVTYLGTFDTPEEAHEAFKVAAEQLHGEFYSPSINPSKEPVLWQ